MKNPKQKRNHYTQEQREDHVKAALAHKGGEKAYCALVGIHPSLMQKWIAAINGRRPLSRPGRPKFVPVTVDAPEATSLPVPAAAEASGPASDGSAGLVLVTRRGHRVILARDFDADALRRLLRILES